MCERINCGGGGGRRLHSVYKLKSNSKNAYIFYTVIYIYIRVHIMIICDRGIYFSRTGTSVKIVFVALVAAVWFVYRSLIASWRDRSRSDRKCVCRYTIRKHAFPGLTRIESPPLPPPPTWFGLFERGRLIPALPPLGARSGVCTIFRGGAVDGTRYRRT